ncbi:MAG: LuxR C-terminal-related transcriptional regulator [Pyrinomonadaceae bacterium]
MYPRKKQFIDAAEPVNYSFGEYRGQSWDKEEMALLALSHTPVEHQLYKTMFTETSGQQSRLGAFSARHLVLLTGLQSITTIRRGLNGLLNKLSIERQNGAENGNGQHQQGTVYQVFSPVEIFARREAAGHPPYPREIQTYKTNRAYGLAIERVVGLNNLSRREAQVALCCAQGMTNAAIGEKLHVSEQTIKFHLRHIFIKFGVKRRAELVARLLTQDQDWERGESL